MKNQGTFVTTFLAVILIAAVVGCSQAAPGPTTAPAPQPTSTAAPTSASSPAYTLTMNWESSPGKTQCTVWPFRPNGRFQELLKQYTNNRLTLDVKDGLFGGAESLIATADGRVDMGTQLPAFSSGTYPLLDFGGLPGFFTDGPNVGYEWTRALFDPRMQTVLEAYTRPKGFIVLGGMPALGSSGMFGKSPITTIADFSGKKIRGGGVYLVKMLAALGANVVSISSAEVTDALTKGTVDAVNTTFNFALEHEYYNLVTNFSYWPIGSQPFPMLVAVNVKKWDALPKDIQDGLRAASVDMSKEIAAADEQQDYTYKIWAKSTKAKFSEADPAEVAKAPEKLVSVYQDWLKAAGPSGKDVLSIAGNYASGPCKNKIVELAK